MVTETAIISSPCPVQKESDSLSLPILEKNPINPEYNDILTAKDPSCEKIL